LTARADVNHIQRFHTPGQHSMPTLGEALVIVWRQALAEGKHTVGLPNGVFSVSRTRNQGLITVYFRYGTYQIEGIEQNPLTTSEWGQRASHGERVMQFLSLGEYVGNVAEGVLTRYPAWKHQGLPE
jgi:hypothetical protein